MDIIVTQIILGIILFFIINWIGKNSYSMGYLSLSLFIKSDEAPAFNILLRVLSPLVYIIIVSAVLYQLKLDRYVSNIYLVCVYYLIIRLLINLITNRCLLLNWVRQFFYWFFIIGLSITIYQTLIINKKNILPDFTTMANELWIIIAIFVYSILNKIPQSVNSTIKRKNNYINSRFNVFKEKYDSIISSKTNKDKLKALTYSIMIYEDYNRPRLIRYVEYLWFYISKKPLTMGIMQVRSSVIINDYKSVEKSVDLILNYYNITLKEFNKNDVTYERYHFLPLLIQKYNGGSKYQNDVLELYEDILKRFYPDTKDQLIIKIE